MDASGDSSGSASFFGSSLDAHLREDVEVLLGASSARASTSRRGRGTAGGTRAPDQGEAESREAAPEALRSRRVPEPREVGYRCHHRPRGGGERRRRCRRRGSGASPSRHTTAAGPCLRREGDRLRRNRVARVIRRPMPATPRWKAVLVGLVLAATACGSTPVAPSNPVPVAAAPCSAPPAPLVAPLPVSSPAVDPTDFAALAEAQIAANAKPGMRHIPAHDVPVPTNDVMAAGSGRCSSRARSTIASVIPPPVELPKIAMFFGFAIVTAFFQTAIASSIAAGYGKSGGMR